MDHHLNYRLSSPNYLQGSHWGAFKQQYRCYSVAMRSQAWNDGSLEEGGRIIMPPSALSELTQRNIQYPIIFNLSSQRTDLQMHCGVLEFVAEEGKIYIPHWMMRNIGLVEGDYVWLEHVTLPLATFVKFQPQSIDFLGISDFKAVLERKLRNFACLTVGDVIAVHYNDKVYEMQVLEAKPGKSVTIIDCDMEVDFAAPVGYKEPPPPEPKVEEPESLFQLPPASQGISAFLGAGQRLDGKTSTAGQESQSGTEQTSSTLTQRGIPYHDFTVGKLTFVSSKKLQAELKKKTELDKAASKDEFKPFGGTGLKLRPKLNYRPKVVIY